ncbi:MAG: hypothetical protein JW725_02680 [Candidatus Babeliaceae bacterium]|nr:hypothetical protein [Candidatus Babeliaceae bacterium]
MVQSRLRDILDRSDFAFLFNGISNPPGRACELESVRVFDSDDTVSFLFSCTRVLVVPDGETRSLEHLFLARIPVIVRYLFRYALVEISIPHFSEPAGFSTNSSHRTPERYQAITTYTRSELQQILPHRIRAINFAKLTLYLEAHCDAVDMGWRIEPQEEAEFDLTQSLIPLKKILGSFSKQLKDECQRRGRNDLLSGLNLYQVFRALKEDSYTYSLVLQAPIGRRGGEYLISALYGPRNAAGDPILFVPDNNRSVIESIRDAVNQSQIVEIINPYDLDALLA